MYQKTICQVQNYAIRGKIKPWNFIKHVTNITLNKQKKVEAKLSKMRTKHISSKAQLPHCAL